MRTELPTGTVTFLFTDIEGSTRRCRRRTPTHLVDDDLDGQTVP